MAANVTAVITYRDGKRGTVSMSSFVASLLVLCPPDDVASLRIVGGCDDFIRSHVPFTPYTERAGNQRGREMADAN